MDAEIEIDYFDNIDSMIKSNFVKNFVKFQKFIAPSYLYESPYRELLETTAKGDGKYYSVLRKAKLSKSVGESIVKELVELDILTIEYSREAPLKSYPKQKLSKDIRSYRIQDKLRFSKPFMRFWFGFVTYYKDELAEGNAKRFLANFTQHFERLCSLVFEQLCNDVLLAHYQDKEEIVSAGSYWNIYSEFDILAITRSKKIILGECKYKERTICKNELTKLKQKAAESGMKVDTFALFSKSGFSKELLSMKNEKLLLFDLNDLKVLL